MKVILIAHNQVQLVQQRLRELHELEGLDADDIVIADNASEDGLGELLLSQTTYNYVICDEGMESYARILNLVIAEFVLDEDVFCYTPDYLLVQGMLGEMEQLLHSEEQIGAVSPVILDDEAKKDKFSYAEKKNRKTLALIPGVMLIKYAAYQKIGPFDERIFGADSVLRDFLFRGICLDYKYMECGSTYSYSGRENPYSWKMNKIEDSVKQKWGMNYFNVTPNQGMVQMIKEDRNKEFHVLEVGCDCGATLLEIGNYYPNAGLYGVEINKEAAEIAGHIASVQTGNIEDRNLDFDVKFDYILFGDVLEHLRDPAATVRYCKSLLQTGGRIVACIPNLMHYMIIRELLNGDFTYRDSGLLDRTHIHFFTYNEIIRMFETEGYVIEKIVYRSWNVPQGDEVFVDSLMNISDEAERFMFYAVQYLVTAVLAE